MSGLKLLFDVQNESKYLDTTAKPERQRSRNVKYKRFNARLKVYENSFFPHIIDSWNKLPLTIANECDKNKFIMKLENFYKT